MPGLGEIPISTPLQAYYKLENANDSTSNAFNLTNYATVAFISSSFTNGADFSNSGTTKALQTTSNVLGTVTTNEVSFWFKLNNTTSANAGARLFTSSSTGVSGFSFFCGYSISAGNLTITLTGVLSVTNSAASVTVTADSNWHWVRCVFDGTGVVLRYDVATTNSNTGTGVRTAGASQAFTIANNGARTTSAWVVMDEVIVRNTITPTLGDIYRYYTQAKGRFSKGM